MGCIYFFKNPSDGYVKMGYTSRDLKIRLREWQRLIPHKLEYLGYQEGSVYLEKYLKEVEFLPHMVVTEDGNITEWFYPHESIMKYIKNKCSKICTT